MTLDDMIKKIADVRVHMPDAIEVRTTPVVCEALLREAGGATDSVFIIHGIRVIGDRRVPPGQMLWVTDRLPVFDGE